MTSERYKYMVGLRRRFLSQRVLLEFFHMRQEKVESLHCIVFQLDDNSRCVH